MNVEMRHISPIVKDSYYLKKPYPGKPYVGVKIKKLLLSSRETLPKVGVISQFLAVQGELHHPSKLFCT